LLSIKSQARAPVASLIHNLIANMVNEAAAARHAETMAQPMTLKRDRSGQARRAGLDNPRLNPITLKSIGFQARNRSLRGDH
jgi:hypothetical protein